MEEMRTIGQPDMITIGLPNMRVIGAPYVAKDVASQDVEEEEDITPNPEN